MTREPFIAHSELTNEIYIVVGKEKYRVTEQAIKAVMAIKALEQEPKTGHWIMTNDYLTAAYGSIDYVKCSCCGEESLEEGNYCPNCGAKMVEPQESEDKE